MTETVSVAAPRHMLLEPAPRLIRGSGRWWFLGPGGVARVAGRDVDDDGRLRPAAAEALRAAGLFRARPVDAYSLTVLTSTACNLGCGYCFQNTAQDEAGGHRPPRMPRVVLGASTIDRILRFTAERMRAAALERLRVMLFGGEPLLNRRGCLDLLARAGEHGLVSASMVTNGTLLTPDIATRLAASGLRSVQVTFDGDRDDHDRIRARRSGTGTFDHIVGNVARVTAVTDINWTLRVNVSHLNRHSIGDLVGRLADHLVPERCTLDLAWVGDIGVGYHNELNRTDELATAFGSWLRRAVDLGFRVARPGPDTPCQACSFRGGRYGAVVSADGTLASCWETAGQREWVIGSVDTGYGPANEIEPRWTSCYARHEEVDGPVAAERFRDRVDADLLDHLDASGRL